MIVCFYHVTYPFRSHYVFLEQGVPWNFCSYRVQSHSENVYGMIKTHSQHITKIGSHNTGQLFGQFEQMVECSLYEQVNVGLDSVTVT